jgi:phosphate/sulfate permease
VKSSNTFDLEGRDILALAFSVTPGAEIGSWFWEVKDKVGKSCGNPGVGRVDKLNSMENRLPGYAGAAIAKAGFGSLLLKGWAPVILFLLISPVIGLLLGYCFMVVTIWLSHSRERHKAERTFRHLQLLSAGAYSLGHGTNDAQKTMGIIAALLVASGKKEWTVGHVHLLWVKHELAMWIILSCHAAMAIGTMLGGW